VERHLHCGTVLLLVVLWVIITSTMQAKTARMLLEGVNM
jgi:hypothetical protein